MGMDPVTIMTAAAVLGAGASVYEGQQQASAQKDAAQQAKTAAEATADATDQANNKANAKTPDVAAMLSANQQAATEGASSTMLTGAGGISPSTLQIGKNTLLGS